MASCPSGEQKLIEEPLLDKNLDSQKGGSRTIPFILANEAFLGVATYGLLQNMILYLMRVYHLDMATGSNISFFWSAAMNFMPLLGAIIADSFLGRFWMIGFGSVVNLVGLIVLCLTTIIPQARPAPCNELNNGCTSATAFQLFFLCSSFGLISLGAGGVRSSSIAFGADQFKKGDDRKVLPYWNDILTGIMLLGHLQYSLLTVASSIFKTRLDGKLVLEFQLCSCPFRLFPSSRHPPYISS